MDPSSAVRLLIDRFVGHGLSPASAHAVLAGAAHRKGTTPEALALRIWTGA